MTILYNMFTGIIEKKASIISCHQWEFIIENHFWMNLKIWQSIAHDGACMTIEDFDKKHYKIFVMEESLKKTNFWEKKVWDYFNIERCLKSWERIDGHFVSGHIDSVWEVVFLERKKDNSLIVWISFPEKFSNYTIEKWSIAINGVSLTIIDKKPWYISVSLIPITQDWTNLWKLILWEKVNIEFDMLGKYILNT